MEILIFKTNIQTDADVASIAPALNSEKTISIWNVDLEDCDKILRIVGEKVETNVIEDLVKKLGFECFQIF